ncbi:MAG: hypothetical protein MUP21_05380 [Dehalococcoidia bacterium]|nr:hypothetical protein [Dehalococcoidia bacterium]
MDKKHLRIVDESFPAVIEEEIFYGDNQGDGNDPDAEYEMIRHGRGHGDGTGAAEGWGDGCGNGDGRGWGCGSAWPNCGDPDWGGGGGGGGSYRDGNGEAKYGNV